MSPQRHISAQLKRVLVLIFIFVVAPSACLLSVGVLVLALGHRPKDVILGILILGLVATMVVGTTTMLIYLFRSATLARLQTDFVHKVSHDLRTPLTGIRMFADTLLLGRARDEASTRECLESIQVETIRLTAMIDRLLEWGKMEAGKRLYEPALHEVREIIDGALAAMEPQLQSSPAAVAVEVPADLPRVSVDLDAMIEALLNLLQNALKYSGDDKHIAVRCERSRHEVTIAVSDNGPGVPPAEHRRVFEKFYRGKDERSRSIPGTGLGLAIVEHIVRGHEGRVTLESEPGRGATFTLHLPALGT
ncbi:MAG: HAMP domain-containing histidine kinase [Deltaproteobacteria bacterium]|nr:HAMP domain-containing histidine kinase [Deltaproteobacteria bacterium]